MIELTGLNKEYVDLLRTRWGADENEHGKKYLLEELEEHGGVVRKDYSTNKWGIEYTHFYFKDGDRTSYYTKPK